jgi:hypothetical protein
MEAWLQRLTTRRIPNPKGKEEWLLNSAIGAGRSYVADWRFCSKRIRKIKPLADATLTQFDPERGADSRASILLCSPIRVMNKGLWNHEDRKANPGNAYQGTPRLV